MAMMIKGGRKDFSYPWLSYSAISGANSEPPLNPVNLCIPGHLHRERISSTLPSTSSRLAPSRCHRRTALWLRILFTLLRAVPKTPYRIITRHTTVNNAMVTYNSMSGLATGTSPSEAMPVNIGSAQQNIQMDVFDQDIVFDESLLYARVLPPHTAELTTTVTEQHCITSPSAPPTT